MNINQVVSTIQPLTYINIRQMAGKDPERLMVVCSPETRRAVVATGHEVMPVGRPPHIPHRPHVSPVYDQAGPTL